MLLVELKYERSIIVQQTMEKRDLTADEKRLPEKGVFTGEMLKDVSFAERTGAQLEKIEQITPRLWKC